jgi:hypothetical protein
MPKNTTLTAEFKTSLNSCSNKSHQQHTKISDLREDIPYRINKFQRVNTPYGESVISTLEGHPGDDFFLRVFLPRRYNEVISDRFIEAYNSGEMESIQLIKRCALQSNSNITPLEFL